MKKNKDHNEVTNILQPESNFIEEVEAHVATSDVTLIDAILHWCEKRDIQIEQIVPLIKTNSKFKKKFTEEAERLNFLK